MFRVVAEITFLLSVPDFQVVNNGVVFTDWVYGLGELFEPIEETLTHLSATTYIRANYTSWQSVN